MALLAGIAPQSQLVSGTVAHSGIPAADIARRPRREAPQVDQDLELIVDLQDGDEAGLTAIMERYKDPLFGFIYRHVQNESDAADILEETFVKVCLNCQRFKPTARFRTWLYTIATNLCRDWARRRKRKPAMPVAEIYEDQIESGVVADLLLPERSSPSGEA